ncbi:hypothetical protein DPMN_172234 [Dreissena polymorpha]|uniref:DNA 3'-5' helicase n=2 Tax=Dreissena polymorpha TaxID=45954 RepID=A0A9D4E1X6_DREPO|nr:hypothetical protein DPMN_172234 [Dreissena polymorpha]
MARLALDIAAHLKDAADGAKVFKLYHSGMCNSDLKSILEEFTQPDSCTRFLISTIAFGIGINIPDIRFIIHWGAPKTLEDYWQEVGRAGRDGKAAQAKMYATKVSLLNCSEEMKTLVKSE